MRVRVFQMGSRIWNSGVFWLWGFNGLRLSSGLLLLPLLVHQLSDADLGLYYGLLNLLTIVPVLDMGMASSVERNVSYVMGGARQLVAHGLSTPGETHDAPNHRLLWQLLHATRAYYRAISVIFFLLFAGLGTFLLADKIPQTTSPGLSWAAWIIALGTACLEIYAGWWNVFLRGMNQVVVSARIQFLAHSVRLFLGIVLLLAGAGLPSVFIGSAVASLLARHLSRRACQRHLPADSAPANRSEIKSILRILWPSGWRVGVQLSSGYLLTVMLLQLCTERYGLAGYSVYGLSLQVVWIIQGIALVWITVKWPLVGQYRARHDHAALRQVLWSRLWFQAGTYVVLALIAHQLGPALLEWSQTNKQLMPPPWFLALLIAGFFDSQVTFWTTLLSTENRVPSVWPISFTNLVSLVLVFVLLQTTSIGLGAFALGPLLAGALFNYWFWPLAGARNLKTTWLRFMFRRQHG
jgi:hypothetical protein